MRKGYNPRQHGRASHHPLLAVLAEATFVLHGWLRSGHCTAARGVAGRARIRIVRADAEFFEEPLLSFLEARRRHAALSATSDPARRVFLCGAILACAGYHREVHLPPPGQVSSTTALCSTDS